MDVAIEDAELALLVESARGLREPHVFLRLCECLVYYIAWDTELNR
jgi:hypothetical protein